MKQIGLLLTFLLLFLVACGSGGTETAEQAESEEPSAATALPVTAEPTDELLGNVTPQSDTDLFEEADDPLQARERDWKEGNTVDPAVTVIEYGDFQ
ncbi:MAG: hypothetical protein KC410_02090 [Anaerolineales bacterium]|uniref:hypothetical protein n=1 Tax=Promineifilum sp. TaxID=2664178 RepID=UPI001DE2CEDE|nr:hypothetical protein [Anaerolineales bacterium]MCO5178614.1 hypothetical protein [Promineifilum sp.]